MADLSFKNWQVDLVRVTAFYGQISEEARKGWPSWWTTLVGVPSEKTELRRRDAVLHEVGPYKGGDLILGIQPGRIDWYLRATDKVDDRAESSGEIAALTHDATKSFYDLILRWIKLDSCPTIKRIAVGAILLQPVENRQTGYRKLNAYLHSFKLDPEASDFLYQINRPRTSRTGITDLRINRLCKWSVALLGEVAVSLSVGPKDIGPLTGSVEGQGHYACRLELDVNTSQEHEGDFSGDTLSTIFAELVDHAQEISERGDIP
jgi:hypothetical protein